MAVVNSLNSQSYPPLINNMVTFSDIPNILTFSSTTNVETFTTYVITPADDWFENVTGSGQYFLTIDGDTIENTISDEVVGKHFAILDNAAATAFSMANALRNCQAINATWRIYYDSENEAVVLKARKGGRITASIIDETEGNLTLNVTYGTTNNDLHQAKCYIDFYEVEGDNYLTTAMKNAYGDRCSFNITPIISTSAEYGNINKLRLDMYVLPQGGDVYNVTSYFCNAVPGYKTTYSSNFLSNMSGECTLAQAIEAAGEYLDLYIYESSTTLCFINNRTGQTYDCQIQYLDATSGVISSVTETITFDSMFQEHTFALDANKMKQAFHIKITIPNGYILYHIIKPLKATPENTRLYWRNEYGGISFFDFTGEHSDEVDMDNTTYETTVLDYYRRQEMENARVFDATYEKTYTVSSHLLPARGTLIFESLAKSKKIWTSINGSIYTVILQDVEVEEQDVRKTYKATVSYKLSIEEQ